MNWTEYQTVFRSIVRPYEFFRTAPDVYGWLKRIAVILLFLTGLLVLTRFLYPDPVVPPAPGNLALRNPDAITRLLFPLHFLAYVVFASVVRHVLLVILGDERRGFPRMVLLCAFSAFPLFLVAACMGVVNNLLPYWLHASSAGMVSVRMSVSMLLLLGGYFWEGWLSTVGLRQWFGQNSGRAVLTWLAPLIAVVLLISPLLFVLQFARA